MMWNRIKKKIIKNAEITTLALLLIITISSTTYYNYSKKKIFNNYKDIIGNVYFKKSIRHLFDNLEPKFKRISHKISAGETFDNILSEYSISQAEILEIKKNLSKKINLNKLKTDQKIELVIDQSNNVVKEFIFKISTTEKIYLTKDTKTDKFDQRIIVKKLKKNIIYSENVILQSLYKSALNKKIPAGLIA